MSRIRCGVVLVWSSKVLLSKKTIDEYTADMPMTEPLRALDHASGVGPYLTANASTAHPLRLTSDEVGLRVIVLGCLR